MTKTERIEEMERQLATLKAEVKEEKLAEYPCVMKEGAVIWYMHDRHNGYQINFIDNDFGFKLTKGLCSGVEKFTGTITYKNGKPV